MAELNFQEWTPGRRRARAEAKVRLVLDFLEQQGWSIKEVIAELLQFRHPGKAHEFLRRLARVGLVYDHKLAVPGSYKTIWTLQRNFRLSTISVRLLEHACDIQRLMLAASRTGWHNLERPGHGLVAEGDAFPDFVGIAPGLGKVAVEVERSPRTNYEQPLLARLVKRKTEGWALLLYLCPTEALAQKVRDRIERVTRNAGQPNGAHVVIDGRRERVPADLANWIFVTTYENFLGKAVGNAVGNCEPLRESPTVSGILQ
jgi:hypothetical protein